MVARAGKLPYYGQTILLFQKGSSGRCIRNRGLLRHVDWFWVWCPRLRGDLGVMVSRLMRNPYQAIDGVEGVEGIEKCERFVYSVDSGISLRRKGLLKSQGSSPFFGTNHIKINDLERI
jgi:hypothetical protein